MGDRTQNLLIVAYKTDKVIFHEPDEHGMLLLKQPSYLSGLEGPFATPVDDK